MNILAPINAKGRTRPSSQSPVFAASFTPPDPNTGNVINIGIITAAITINAPAGTPADGDWILLRITQNGTGGFAYTWNAIFAFSTDILATDLPTTANAKFEIMFRYNATDSKWRVAGLQRGF